MIRVLVVDDDFMVARLHASVVAAQPGFGVAGVASTGAQALDLVERLAPDLVLLDIYLPDTTGLEVLHTVRESARGGSLPGPDFIVLSAARDVDSLRQARHGGVFQYLVKPFEVETLRQRLVDYADYRGSVAQVGEAQQDDVDRMFGTAGPRPRHDPPKGISAETVDVVLATLRAAPDDLSASECAELAELSRSSARRYLEHLVGTGHASVRHRYGGAGRPERRYSAR